MLYNKTNLKAAKIAAQDKTRPVLSGVYFTSHSTVATDSYKLIEIDCPKDDPKDFPNVSGADDRPLNGHEPFIVPADTCKQLERDIPKGTRTLPILNNIAVLKPTVNPTQARFATTDLETANIKHSRIIEGEYPNYRQLFPDKEPAFTIGVNAQYLIDLLSLYPKGATVKLDVYDPLKPIKLTGKDNEQNITGLLMPVRLK